MTSDYEDKFLRLRDEHRELQQRHNEAEEQIRRCGLRVAEHKANVRTMLVVVDWAGVRSPSCVHNRLNTMLQQIENAWQKKARGEASADGAFAQTELHRIC